jgi:hypothetical protein
MDVSLIHVLRLVVLPKFDTLPAHQARPRTALLQGSQSACPRTQATYNNLLQRRLALWTFVTHPEVEPTNNDAEVSDPSQTARPSYRAPGALVRAGRCLCI